MNQALQDVIEHRQHHECLRANAGSSRTIPPWKAVSRPERMRASCRPSLSLDG
jgi:hypothetical protein